MSDVEAPELLDGLMVQPWQPFKCDVIDYIEQDMDDEFSELLDMEQEDDTNDDGKRFQIKCEFMDSCVAILMTDLVNVWYCEQEESEIQSIQRTLNAAMHSNSSPQILNQIRNMLCLSDQVGSDHLRKISFNNETKQSFTLEAKMKIENIIDFKWSFEFTKYGSAKDQATLLKQQLILPLMAIANELASKLNPQQRNPNNNNSVFQHKITDTFLEFNIRGTLGDLYKNTMTLITQSQQFGCATQSQPQPQSDNQMVSNVVVSSILSMPRLPKGRKKKRALVESMEDAKEIMESEPMCKRRRVSESDDDDDVLNGLIGRERDLNMSSLHAQSNAKSEDTDAIMTQYTQQETEALKRREELRQKLQQKKTQKKKKKKKKKLRI